MGRPACDVLLAGTTPTCRGPHWCCTAGGSLQAVAAAVPEGLRRSRSVRFAPSLFAFTFRCSQCSLLSLFAALTVRRRQGQVTGPAGRRRRRRRRCRETVRAGAGGWAGARGRARAGGRTSLRPAATSSRRSCSRGRGNQGKRFEVLQSSKFASLLPGAAVAGARAQGRWRSCRHGSNRRFASCAARGRHSSGREPPARERQQQVTHFVC